MVSLQRKKHPSMNRSASLSEDKSLGNNREDSEENSSVGSLDSQEEALCELLGLSSLSCLGDDDSPRGSDELGPSHSDDHWRNRSETFVRQRIGSKWKECYELQGYARFDSSLNLPPAYLRRITEQLVWGSDQSPELKRIQRTYERITKCESPEQQRYATKRCLTRLEYFCDTTAWREVAEYVCLCLSVALQQPMVLYKEKLNLKPSGGSGFAPHLDTPSLRQLGKDDYCPSEFVTVLVAIDDMNLANGCLRVVPGAWKEENAVLTETASIGVDNDNPDGGGRRGLIPSYISDTLDFQPLPCRGGDMIAFSGWTPHRSGCNQSHFSRRAVFFTYHPLADGYLREAYYQRMQSLRDEYRKKRLAIGDASVTGPSGPDECDTLAEWQALKSIPRI